MNIGKKVPVAFVISLLLAVVCLASIGCTGPYKEELFEEVGPNETAFVVPLEGDSLGNQGKFSSVEFLQKSRVAAKRISLPQRQVDTGRAYWNYKWVPTARVIKVDRTPITREWTKVAGTGTSTSNQAIAVESIESINFGAGVTITGAITEEDAATFLYWYAGRPLTEVMDQNIRGFVVSFLSREFGGMKIDDARLHKKEVFVALAEAVKKEFKARGITILNIGSSEGLAYDDPKVQAAINMAYTAQRDRERATVEAETAAIRADGKAKAAIREAEGQAKANQTVQASLTGAILTLRKIEAWDGKLPKVTGGGSIPMIDLKE